MKLLAIRILPAAACVLAVTTVPIAAQQVANWSNAGSDFIWRSANNWVWPELGYPDSPTVSAHFNNFSNDQGGSGAAAFESRIDIEFFPSSWLDQIPAYLDLASIILEDTNTTSRWLRNSTVGTTANQSWGIIRIHGTPAEINGEQVNLLIGNYSVADRDSVDLRLHMSASTRITNIFLPNSGVVHTEHPNTRVWFTIPVLEGDEPVTITKTGPGILQYGVSFSATPGRMETTGGFIIKEGVFQATLGATFDGDQWATSSLGYGPVTLHDGVTFRSASTGSRVWGNNFFMEGNVTIGSQDPEMNGAMTFSAAVGGITTLLSDVTFDIQATTVFNQTVVGDYHVTKIGPERLTFAGENNTFTKMTIQEGNITFNGTNHGSACMPPNPAEPVLDQFTIDGGALRFINFGATLGSNRGITLTPKGGAIEVAGTWLMGTNAPMVDADPENPGPFAKIGTGTWTMAPLSVASHRGPTTVEEGRLVVNGRIESSPVEVLAGARIGGAGQFGGELVVRSGAEFFAGARTIVGVTQAEAPVTLEAGVNASFRLESRDSSSRLRAEQGVQFQEVNLAIDLLHQPYGTDTYVLIENAGAPGSLTGLFLYNGTPLQEGDTFLVEQDIDPTDPTLGAYSVEFTITYDYNGGGYQNSVAIVAGGEAPPPPGGAYNAWRIERFGNDTDPAGAPDAQPAGQAVANLLFHALGLDLGADAAAGVPAAVAEGTISFTRRTPLGTRLVVEGADDLTGGSWTELAVLEPGADSWTGPATVGEEPAGEGLVRVTVTDPNSPATGTRFLRVRADLP